MLETASPARKVHLTQPPEFWTASVEHNRLRKLKLEPSTS
jgi:hypothetical protein